jgi:hypothetical protein
MSADVVSLNIYARLPEQYRLRAEEIKRRVEAIDSLMVPCQVVAIRDAVIRLRGQFRPQPDTEAETLASEYLSACRDLPEWAISEAANDFLAGRVDSHTGQFMPTCAEFAKRARSILVPFLSERMSLRTEASKLIERAEDDRKRHLIDMERQNPAVRRRVAALTDAFTAGSPKSQALPHLGLNEKEQARLDALKKPRQFVSKIGHTKNPEA